MSVLSSVVIAARYAATGGLIYLAVFRGQRWAMTLILVLIALAFEALIFLYVERRR